MFKILSRFFQSYFFILVLAFIGGIFFSRYTIYLSQYTTLFLALIFFLSGLKMNFREVGGYLREKKIIIAVSFFTLLILPLVVYYLANWLVPSLALPLLLLAAMPCGMTAPLFSELLGGKPSLALVLVIVTSLLAPFTIPLVIKLSVGTAITLAVGPIFWSLLQVIAAPLILAFIVRSLFIREKINKLRRPIKFLYLIFLGLLLAGVIASQAAVIGQILIGEGLYSVIVLFIFFILLHLVSYYVAFWRARADRLTVVVAISYMNFTLAIYLAGKFFPAPEVLVPVILSVLPWSLLFTPFRFLVKRLK